jgi:hypothetical protein
MWNMVVLLRKVQLLPSPLCRAWHQSHKGWHELGQAELHWKLSSLRGGSQGSC